MALEFGLGIDERGGERGGVGGGVGGAILDLVRPSARLVWREPR